MKPFRITPATVEDAAALTGIASSAKRHWGYPETWIHEWAGLLTITAEFVREHPTFKAEDSTGVVGVAAIEVNGREALLVHLWVKPGAMGKGVGAALFAESETAARVAGAMRLVVESDPNAEAFYRRMGATKVGSVPASVHGVERYLPVLEKRLCQVTPFISPATVGPDC